jgi:hypothetical protein
VLLIGGGGGRGGQRGGGVAGMRSDMPHGEPSDVAPELSEDDIPF